MEKRYDAVCMTTQTIGVIFGVAGFEHGLFEFLQGNRATNGLLIEAIGPGQRFWELGTEDAFTLIPNFLATGIASMVVGITIIAWSLLFLHTHHGSTVFLSLFVLLFLVGGGVGQIAFFLPAWAFSTRMNKPLLFWKRILPPPARAVLSALWPPLLLAASLVMLFGLEIAVFGWVPGLTDPVSLQALGLLLVLVAAALYVVTYVSAIGRELHRAHAVASRP